MSYIVWWIANGQIDNKLKLTDLCVIPAQAGIQATVAVVDSCVHRNDRLLYVLIKEALTSQFGSRAVSLSNK